MEERYDYPDDPVEAGEDGESGETGETGEDGEAGDAGEAGVAGDEISRAENNDYRPPKIKRNLRFLFARSPTQKLLFGQTLTGN